MDARVFISNRRCGGKSKTVERQKETVLLEEKDSVGNKIDC
jgi:hypothetical protein